MSIITIQIIHNGIFSHQNLCRYMIVFRKQFLISHHQTGLTDCRACLFYSHGLCLGLSLNCLQIHCFFAHGNGTGSHQYDFLSLIADITEFSHQLFQPDIIQISCFGML